MKNKIAISILLVIPYITRPADGPQVFEQAEAVAAPLQVERIVNLPKIIEAAKQGENFKFEIKSKIYSAVTLKMGFKEAMAVRSKLFSKINALFGDKDDQGSVSEADLCAILDQLKDELGLQLNVLTSDVIEPSMPIMPDVEQEVTSILAPIVNQIANPVAPVVISDGDESDKLCEICYNPLDNGKKTKRGICDAPQHRHVFHKKCINPWLENPNNENLCPKCRQIFIRCPKIYLASKKAVRYAKMAVEFYLIQKFPIIGSIHSAILLGQFAAVITPDLVQLAFPPEHVLYNDSQEQHIGQVLDYTLLSSIISAKLWEFSADIAMQGALDLGEDGLRKFGTVSACAIGIVGIGMAMKKAVQTSYTAATSRNLGILGLFGTTCTLCLHAKPIIRFSKELYKSIK